MAVVSSCCEMLVKSRNERNPYPLLPAVRRELKETASDKLEEGGDDVKSSWPLRPGLHVLQWRIQEATSREQADLIKCVVVRIGVCNSTP